MTAPAEKVRDQILVAEDSPPLRKILCHLLEKVGFEVIPCEDGQKAWDELQSGKHTRIVAVLTDVMMPNLDGISLLKTIRESEPHAKLPVVLVTAVSEKDQILKAKSLNVNGYILKPVTFQRVVAKLKDVFPQREFPPVAAA